MQSKKNDLQVSASNANSRGFFVRHLYELTSTKSSIFCKNPNFTDS